MSFLHKAIGELIDDRPEDGVFRVDRRAFTDPDVFQLELQRVFEGTWVFVALASELSRPFDYVTRQIGRQNILLTRDADGELHGFLNSCRHRGVTLCPLTGGNRRSHVCRYHGWTYDSAGRNIAISGQRSGEYDKRFVEENHDLVPVARLDRYRDFVFASLSSNVPSLAEHLGDAARLLDLVSDQAPDGLEYVPGAISYTFAGNWKLQFENGLDAYHFPTTHGAFVDVLSRRPPMDDPKRRGDAGLITDVQASGTISFPRGHAMSWSVGAPGQGPESRPLPRDRDRLALIRDRVGEERLDWMLRQRNLTIFPNLQIIDIQSLQLRTWEPVAVDMTRMRSHCLAPIGEAGPAREFRIRQYEEFFNAGGLATSDDNVMYELLQEGLACSSAGAPHAYDRGIGAQTPALNHFEALGFEPSVCTRSEAGLAFGDESGIHAGYREWLRLIRCEESI